MIKGTDLREEDKAKVEESPDKNTESINSCFGIGIVAHSKRKYDTDH